MEVGDQLIGMVVEVAWRTSRYGRPYPLLSVLTEDGRELTVLGTAGTLGAYIARLAPAMGDTVGIVYHGPTDGGMDRYRMVVERSGWGAATDPETEPGPDLQEAAGAQL